MQALEPHATALCKLRRKIERLGTTSSERRTLAFGIEAIDRALPGGGLARGAVHEITEQGTDGARASLSALFAAGILARLPGPVIWCLHSRDLFAPALARVGLHPDRVIYCETWKDADVLPAMEEGLRHGGLAGVVGELVRLPLTPSRRLQLAAEASGMIAFALRRSGSASDEANACFSRWRISASPSGPMVDFDMGAPAGVLIFCAAGARKPTPLLWRLAMRRVVSLFLPTWATDRLRRRNGGLPQPEVPLITAMQDGNQRVIASVDEAARRLKLCPGMTIAHAQSLVPGLQIHDAMPHEDEAALARLGLWCTRYSPLVATDPPDGIFIDIAGSAHLFKGEAALLQDLKSRMAASKIAARAAVADTLGCAWAVARFGKEEIVAPGRASELLGSLPVRALRLAPATVESLHDVGIERIAQLASKPRASLQTRFGSGLLLRMDQALGSAAEVPISVVPPEVPRSKLRFAEPLSDPDNLQRVIGMLCQSLAGDLEQRGVGARRLDLVFMRVDNIAQAVRIGTSRPNRNAAHLAKLLAERLVLVDPGFGIEEATLTASWIEALTESQTIGAHVAKFGESTDVGELVDRLRVKLGAERVFRVEPVESDIPERATKRVPAMAEAKGVSWPDDLPRPSRLLTPPELVNAMAEVPDAAPRLFVWRKTRHRIVKADGPERILGEWWVSDSDIGLQRNYYRVENIQGERFWLFRDAPVEQGGRWWRHGIGEA